MYLLVVKCERCCSEFQEVHPQKTNMAPENVSLEKGAHPQATNLQEVWGLKLVQMFAVMKGNGSSVREALDDTEAEKTRHAETGRRLPMTCDTPQ